jgi:HAD superfamily hydrolase (TIGR01549 family)
VIKVVVFDLDGTLYNSPLVLKRFAEAAYNTYAKNKKVDYETAKQLIEERRAELKKQTGHAAPYTRALISYGIPISVWHQENSTYFDAGEYIHEDRQLKQVLRQMKVKYKLAVLTNNNQVQAERILIALGVFALFDQVFTYNSFQLLKPDPELFKKIIETMGVIPEECLVIGDRLDVDLEPAQELGMKILAVKGPEDIYKLRL